MNAKLLDIVTCPNCEDSQRLGIADDHLLCSACGKRYVTIQGKPVFCPIPSEQVSDNPPKAPGTGTFWRRMNWEFAERYSRNISGDQVMLEVGTGSGYYKPLFPGSYIGTDLRLTSSVDFACNLVEQRAIKPSSIDMILLSNVLEHVFEFEALVRNALIGLKPGGLLLVMVPWGGGLHYVPDDYFRYTQWSLAAMAGKFGLELVTLEGVFQPFTVVGNAIANLENSIPSDGRVRNSIAKVIARFTRRIMVDKILAYLITGCRPYGVVSDLNMNPEHQKDVGQFPLGYHAAYRKL